MNRFLEIRRAARRPRCSHRHPSRFRALPFPASPGLPSLRLRASPPCVSGPPLPASPGLPSLRRPHCSPGTRVPVAIIVIGHNGAAFLGECLASVFAQTVTPDEILYVDDASTDDSLPVSRAFADRGLQILALQENVGRTQPAWLASTGAPRRSCSSWTATMSSRWITWPPWLPNLQPGRMRLSPAQGNASSAIPTPSPGARSGLLTAPGRQAYRNASKDLLVPSHPISRNKESGRGGQIRTDDFLLPKQALYQAELRPAAGPRAECVP